MHSQVLIIGGVAIAVLVLITMVKRLSASVQLLQRELRRSNEAMKNQIAALKSETKEEREERESKEAARREKARDEAEKRERERREEESLSDSSTDEDYCRCSSPGDACTWK